MRTLRTLAALVVAGIAAPAFAAPSPLYLRQLFTLSPQQPTAVKPRTDAVARIPVGQTAIVGQFLSEPVATGDTAGGAVASLYLVSGRNGMPDCADITVEVFRKTPLDARVVVAHATVQDTIVPKRKLNEPLVVPVVVNGPLANAGDRIGLAVIVTNRCNHQRTVVLNYDAATFPSGVVFTNLPPTTTTTTSTTVPAGSTTTTTSDGGSATTSTTLPADRIATCRALPQTGYNLVRCEIDRMDLMVRAAPFDDLRGEQARKLMLVRLARARVWVDAASLRVNPGSALARTLRQLHRFGRATRVAVAHGRIATDVGTTLLTMQQECFSEARGLGARSR